MFIDSNETIDVINQSIGVLGLELVTTLLTDEVVLESIYSLVQAVQSLNPEERKGILDSLSKFSSKNSVFS